MLENVGPRLTELIICTFLFRQKTQDFSGNGLEGSLLAVFTPVNGTTAKR